MKFKQFLQLISGPSGFFPTPQLRWIIRANPRSTAREEAIAAEVIKQANPRENITGHFPWGPEQQMVLQQLWINPNEMKAQHSPCGSWSSVSSAYRWRDVPIEGSEQLYSDQDGLPVPEAVREPGAVVGDFPGRLGEILGEDYDDS